LGKKKNSLKEKEYPDKGNVKVFTSFEAAEAYELEQKTKLTPLERLASTTALIKKIYNYKSQKYFRIYFDKV
jgi:hypothetical protein